MDVFSCASLLKRPICTFSTKLRKWFSFKPIVNIDSFSSITTKNPCSCPITLMYYDDYSQANHFNLLLPQGSCCTLCNFKLITIYSSGPRQNIFFTLGRVESQYSNVRKNFLLLWVPSIVVTTPHSTMIATRHIPDIICITEFKDNQKAVCTHVVTTE